MADGGWTYAKLRGAAFGAASGWGGGFPRTRPGRWGEGWECG